MAGRARKPAAPSAPSHDYRWALALLAVVVVIAIVYYLISVQAQAPPAPPAPKENASAQVGAVVLDLSQEPVRGNPNASVWLVEFGDFQCPYCARAAPFVKKLLEDFPGRLAFVWKHFPLDSACNPVMRSQLHPEACKAAEAAECAAEQGRFFEYHDRLLVSQDALDVASLKRHAAELGLDAAEFGECLDSGRTTPLVRADIDEAIALDVQSTPTFFINGHVYEGRWSDYEAFKAAVAQAEAEARTG
ncbi:MAG: thioredoxin domain-containing protein [Candidatus Micrarchaeia archaeon]